MTDTPTQMFLMKFSGEILENNGDVVDLAELKKQEGHLFYHFPIIESLLPTFRESRKINVFIPRIESRTGLMKEKIYDLTIEKVFQYNQCLLRCVIEDFTLQYHRKAIIQQKIQEKVMENQSTYS